MPVNIHGKQYVTVAERIAAVHEEHHTDLGIITGIHSEDDSQVTCWARVETPTGTFWGHARSSKTDRSIEGQSPLEVAETSAVGRALGFAGYGVDESIATADEVQKPPTPTVQQPAAYKGNWSKFWVLAKEKGLSKEDVHEYFGMDAGGSLSALAEERAMEQDLSLQGEIDALTDALRART